MAATVIGFTSLSSWAQTPDVPPLPAVWDSVFTVRGGGGYKDNVFLSHAGQQDSGFASMGGDAILLRLSPYGSRFNLFASADAIRFFDTAPSHNEYTAFAQAQVERDLNEKITGWLAGEYFYQNQFADIAFLDATSVATNVAVQAAPVRGHTLTFKPGISLDLSRRFSLALELPATRQYYNEPLDDYWNTGLDCTLGYSYGHQSQISLSYEPGWRFYDTEQALTSSGSAITSSHRRRFQQDLTLAWRHYWDENKHWRTTLKTGGRLVEDNTGGYADYTGFTVSAQIQYRFKSWEAAAEGRVRRYYYDRPVAGAADTSDRRRTEWLASARIERALTKHLRFIASYVHEQVSSNDPLETYTVNSVTGTLQWEF